MSDPTDEQKALVNQPFYDALSDLSQTVSALKGYLGPVVAAPFEAHIEALIDGYGQSMGRLIDLWGQRMEIVPDHADG